MKPLLILFTFLIVSCSRNSQGQKDHKVLVIDLLAEADSELSNVSQIASDIRYIPLETKEECMIRFIQKIIEVNDKIFIKAGGEIFCFDVNGKYLFKLSKAGRGPQEYLFISDFDVTRDGSTFFGLTEKGIIEYGITEKGFEFRKSFNLPSPVPLYMSLVPATTNILLSVAPWLGTEPALSMLVNSNGDVLHTKSNYYRYTRSDQVNTRASWDALQYVSGMNACFKEVFSDTVFYVSGESLTFRPYIIFNSHGTVVSTRFRSDPEFGKNNRYNFSQVAYISEVPGYVLYYCMVKGEKHKIIFDKTENKKLEIDEERKINDDICGGPVFDFGMNAGTGGRFYTSVEALALKNYLESKEFSGRKVQAERRKNELKTLVDALKETDNPVLIVVDPK